MSDNVAALATAVAQAAAVDDRGMRSDNVRCNGDSGGCQQWGVHVLSIEWSHDSTVLGSKGAPVGSAHSCIAPLPVAAAWWTWLWSLSRQVAAAVVAATTARAAAPEAAIFKTAVLDWPVDDVTAAETAAAAILMIALS